MSPTSPLQRLTCESSDEEIVARIVAGDPEPFALLVRRYNQRLFRVVRAVLPLEDETEDVLQDVYLQAFAKLETFEGRSSLSTWLVRIALRAAWARQGLERRRREVQAGLKDRTVASDGHAPAPEESVQMQELGSILQTAIDALPEKHRVIVVLRLIEGLDTKETAAALGLSEVLVRIRLHRARGRLRALLADRALTELPRAYPFGGLRCDAMVQRVMQVIPRA